jgi:hypothetical protein
MVCRSVHISPSCFESCSWFVGVFIFLPKYEHLQTMNSSQNKREKYEHSYKPWTTLKTKDRNMNTPTNHEQLSKQGGGIWTLLQTTNSSGVCRSVHISASCFDSCSCFVGVFIFLPLILRAVRALRISGRNMNTPTNHDQFSKQEAEIWTLLQNHEQLSKQEGEIWTLLQTMKLFMLCRSVHISATYSESC